MPPVDEATQDAQGLAESDAQPVSDAPGVIAPNEVLAAVEEPPEAPPPARATRDTLPGAGAMKGEEDVHLPAQNVMVTVRRLPTPEMAALQLLPDLAGYVELMQKLGAARAEKDEAEREAIVKDVTPQTVATESAWYQIHVAHLAVRDPDLPPVPVECEECGFDHAPSLWSVTQCSFLAPVDLDRILDVGISAVVMRHRRPFSTEQQPDASSSPADTGASTPPTSSPQESPST